MSQGPVAAGRYYRRPAQTEMRTAQVDRGEWPRLLLIVVALLGLYLATAPRTVVLEDDGLFILSSWFLGIEHPPGYPLFVLLGNLATHLPFGTPAWRVHALNGLFAALACGFIYIIARRLVSGRLPAYLAAFGFGVSETFWSQALIADVYPLHALLFFAMLSLAVEQHLAARQDDAAVARRMLATALLLGLSLANHWPLVVLSGPALLVLWLPAWRALVRRLPQLIFALLVGLLPYAWMVWRSHQHPEISFQGPIDGWAEFLRYLLRTNYAGVDDTASSGPVDRLLYLSHIVHLAARQLLVPGAILALIGAIAQWRRWDGRMALSMSAAFLGPTIGLVFLLGFDYQPLQREAFRVYPLVAWGVWGVWAALGLRTVLDRLRPASQRRLAIVAVSGLLAANFALHWDRNNRRGDTLGHDYATTLLTSLAPNASLLVRGDIAVPTTGYLHLIEHVRPDVTLLTENALVLDPRLFDPGSTPGPQRQRALDAYIAAAESPVYRLHNNDARAGTVSWLLFRIRPTSATSASPVEFRMTEPEQRFLRRIAQVDAFDDGWNEMLRRALLARFIDFQTRAEIMGQWTDDDPEMAAIQGRALQLPEAALARAELLFATNPTAHAAEIADLLSRIEKEIDDPGLSKRHLARFYNLIAQIALRNGRDATVRSAIEASLQHWPDDDNPARAVARKLRAADS